MRKMRTYRRVSSSWRVKSVDTWRQNFFDAVLRWSLAVTKMRSEDLYPDWFKLNQIPRARKQSTSGSSGLAYTFFSVVNCPPWSAFVLSCEKVIESDFPRLMLCIANASIFAVRDIKFHCKMANTHTNTLFSKIAHWHRRRNRVAVIRSASCSSTLPSLFADACSLLNALKKSSMD